MCRLAASGSQHRGSVQQATTCNLAFEARMLLHSQSLPHCKGSAMPLEQPVTQCLMPAAAAHAVLAAVSHLPHKLGHVVE